MIRFLFDECLSEHVDVALGVWNSRPDTPTVDAVRVGDVDGLPKGTPDPDILVWAEREGRIVVRVDYNHMPAHPAAHLAAGRHSPGVFCVRPHVNPAAIVHELAVVTVAGNPEDFANVVVFIPF